MRAELLVDLQVIAFADQIDVELAEDLAEAVGIAKLARLAADLDAQPVVEGRPALAQPDCEQAVRVLARQLGKSVSGLVEHPHPFGLRLEGAHEQLVVLAVRAEQGEGVAMIAAHQRIDGGGLRLSRLLSRCHHHDPR